MKQTFLPLSNLKSSVSPNRILSNYLAYSTSERQLNFSLDTFDDKGAEVLEIGRT